MTNQDKSVRARKGELVQVHIVVLAPGERAKTLPEATQVVPYEGWVKGYLLDEEAEIGDRVEIESFIGRKISGILAEINPVYEHDFGEPQPALNPIGKNALHLLEEELFQ
jgi:hypothetical protein